MNGWTMSKWMMLLAAVALSVVAVYQVTSRADECGVECSPDCPQNC